MQNVVMLNLTGNAYLLTLQLYDWTSYMSFKILKGSRLHVR